MSKKTSTQALLWSPRYWIAWIAVALLWLFIQLPYPVQRKIGEILGRLAYRVLPSRRRIAHINIALCFPDLSSDAVERLGKESFIRLGQGILSSALSWWGSTGRLRRLIQAVEGFEHVENALAHGKGVLFLCAHFSSNEIGAHLMMLLLQKKLNVMHRKQSNPVFEAILQRGRLRYMYNVLLRDNIRGLIRCLRNNEIVCYLPDQNFEIEHSIFVPFMGVEALTLTTTARFAKFNDCLVIPSFCFQRDDGQGYDLEFLPALGSYPSGNLYQDTVLINQIFEYGIRKCPAQYMWVHRRFKIRPSGQLPVY